MKSENADKEKQVNDQVLTFEQISKSNNKFHSKIRNQCDKDKFKCWTYAIQLNKLNKVIEERDEIIDVVIDNNETFSIIE